MLRRDWNRRVRRGDNSDYLNNRDKVARMSTVKPVPVPDGAEIEFAEYRATGTVHVVEHVPAPYIRAAGLAEMSFGEGLMAMFSTPRPMLCGARFTVGFPGSRGEWTDCFEDEAFCVRCIRALGDQSARAFEHPRPGDEES